MNLYRESNNGREIEVFEIRPNIEKTIAFKEEELKKVPEDVRFLYASGNVEFFDKWDDLLFNCN